MADMTERGKKGKQIRTVIVALLLLVFAYVGFRLLGYYLEYKRQELLYKDAADTYVEEQPVPVEEPEEETEVEIEDEIEIICPVTIDFDALLAENEETAGWLYCEDTNINYPVMHRDDNDYYLHHSFDGKESSAGTLFVAAENSPGFVDCNTIIYGHHMKNGSMFAKLADWADQEYFDAHSVMWLLTPEQNYKVELFAGYLTSATSATYAVYKGVGPEFEEYLSAVIEASDVQADVETPADGHYIMLSTCEYEFENARYVLFGVLVPCTG